MSATKKGIVALVFVVLLAGIVLADERPYLGIQFRYDADASGIYVMAVVGDSPAEKAGVKVDDVIRKVDTKEFATIQEFLDVLYEKKPGDVVTLTLLRNGEEKTLKVTLGKRPEGNG